MDGKDVTQRPIFGGLIQDTAWDSWSFLLKAIGSTYLDSAIDLRKPPPDFESGTIRSRILMSDSSLTLAGGDPVLIAQALKYRQKLISKSFELLRVQELAVVPPQLLMLLSEMVLDGVVVDVGHEMT